MPLPPVLSLLPDWSQGVREERAFRTSILTTDSGLEQREQTRGRARRRLTYRARTLTAGIAQPATTLLQRVHEGTVALPWWMHRTRLTADAAIGATTLAVVTTGLDFLAGNYALLWRSPRVYELVQVSATDAVSVTLEAGTPTTMAWPTGSLVLPAFPARLAAPLAISRVAARGLDVAVDALVEPLAVPLASGTAGDDPPDFTLAMPMAGPDESESWARRLVSFDGDLGPVASTVFDAAPAVGFGLSLMFRSRAAAQDLWAWYDSVLGALTPSWVPSWQAAAQLSAAVASASNTLVIRAMGYTARWFPDESRRHLAIITAPDVIAHRRVTEAVDNGDGTETLTLNAVVGVNLRAETLVSLMHYARLEQDALALVWQDPDLATAELRFRELPSEEPATV